MCKALGREGDHGGVLSRAQQGQNECSLFSEPLIHNIPVGLHLSPARSSPAGPGPDGCREAGQGTRLHTAAAAEFVPAKKHKQISGKKTRAHNFGHSEKNIYNTHHRSYNSPQSFITCLVQAINLEPPLPPNLIDLWISE